MMTEDLNKIKKLYGEKMMHLCRELFSTLLEQEGLLSKLMIANFAPSKLLYEDIIESRNIEHFKNYIYSLVDVETKEQSQVNKTPKELLEETGYNLYECKTEEEIQNFKKYYAPWEQLCTFNGGRLNSCYVFFAVKKNVDEINRKDFDNPKREDEYGTSVISIQFTRGKTNTLSIKNRYNHTVNNPDATYSNNLENIIEGLIESFEREYKLNINQNTNGRFELPGYVKANDGKYYKYNYEIGNRYYCPNNIIIDDFEVKKLEPEKYVLLDYFILDLVNKEIKLYDKCIEDSFIDGIKDIDRINITKIKEIGNKQIEIMTKDKNEIIIEIDKTNQIIGYKNNKVTHIENHFLNCNKRITNLELPNLIKVGNSFLSGNKCLSNLNLPNLIEVGSYFFRSNENIIQINLPKLQKTGSCFLSDNKCLPNLNLPNLKEVGDNFLRNNEAIDDLSLPLLEMVDGYFLYCNEAITNLNLPKLNTIGRYFLYSNKKIESLNLPSLEQVGSYFLYFNKILQRIELPKLQRLGLCFLYHAKNIKYANLSSLNKYDKEYFKHLHGEAIFYDLEMHEIPIKSTKKSSRLINKIKKNNIKEKIKRKRNKK